MKERPEELLTYNELPHEMQLVSHWLYECGAMFCCERTGWTAYVELPAGNSTYRYRETHGWQLSYTWSDMLNKGFELVV